MSDDDNPMSYFGISAKEPVKPKPEPCVESVRDELEAQIADIVGLGSLKTYLKEDIDTIAYREKRKKLGLPQTAQDAHPLIILTGQGDKEKAVAEITTFKRTAKQINAMKPYRLKAMKIPDYWEDRMRKTIDDILDGKGGIVLVEELGELLKDTGEGANYARFYLTRRIREHLNIEPIIIKAGAKDIQRWIMLCPEAAHIPMRKIQCEPYCPDELSVQFCKMAKQDGYALAPFVMEGISRLFEQITSPVCAQMNKNKLAEDVFSRARLNHSRRLASLTDDLQTRQRMRWFRKDDLPKLLIPCGQSVLVA